MQKVILLTQKVSVKPIFVYHFNPTCEIAIANGSPYFKPSVLLSNFEADLATIMFLFADEDDFVICGNSSNMEFITNLQTLGFSSPHFINIEKFKKVILANQNHPFKLESWGMSPAESYTFQFLNPGINSFNESRKLLYERKTAVSFLKGFLEKNKIPELGKSELIPNIVSTEKELEKLLNATNPIVLKAPFSSSGRGLLVLRKEKLNDANRQWIKSVLDKQNYLCAEYWLNKQLDLSFQFKIDGQRRVSYLGNSYFQTNSNGQYRGHFLNFHKCNKLPFSLNVLNYVGQKLGEELAASVYAKSHQGILGIDALIYFNERGEFKLHPCVEINPRYTMGYLSQKIESKIHAEASGFFKIYYHPNIPFSDFVQNTTKKNPTVVIDGHIRKGFFPLTPTRKSKFGAYVELF